jgi:hypothetical protein
VQFGDDGSDLLAFARYFTKPIFQGIYIRLNFAAKNLPPVPFLNGPQKPILSS